MIAVKYNIACLSDREKEVLVCLCNGISNKEIAAELHLSMRTIKSHLSSIFRKFLWKTGRRLSCTQLRRN
ncbi:DNA-binding response regulator [Clostridium sp. AF34-10BH]|nr:DNA-binding response regulator [Clostridium sp. AF34-10BH]